MNEERWIKYGAIGLAAVGFLVIVGFALVAGDGLEGQTWVVEEMAVDGATMPLVDGVGLTAIFENGNVGGSAGCNGYNAAYETDARSIIIGPAISTLIFCEQPEGTMDQEAAYLSLLQSADRFDVDGEKLVLTGDSTTLRFSALQVDER